MKFTTPEFKRKESPCATYKITFDDKWFYIGSSVSVKSRFTTWRAKIGSAKFRYNRNIKNIISSVSEIKFIVLEIFTNTAEMRLSEKKLLKDSWDNEFLLNRVPETFEGCGVKGIRRYNGYVKPPKPIKVKSGKVTPMKKIARFDLNDNLLEIHPSKGDLHRKYPTCRLKTVNKHIRGEQRSIAGFKFKYVSENGDFIDRVEFIPKRNRLPLT